MTPETLIDEENEARRVYVPTPLTDDLHQIHEWAGNLETYPGPGLEAIRLSCGLTREDIYELTGLPVALLELHEDFGGWPDVETLGALAECYGCTPGELVDAVACVCEAENHDVAGERSDRIQANRLLALLQASPTGEVPYEEMRAAGISTNNAPFNDLYDRGYPVEIVREGPPLPPPMKFDLPSGVRLKRDSS